MEYELACDRIRDDIADTLLELGWPTSGATSLAAAATHDIADALHHAAGNPYDTRWNEAISSLEGFVEICKRSPRAVRSEAFVRLSAFLEENTVAVRVAA